MADTLPNGVVVPEADGDEQISATGVAEMRALGASVDGQLGDRYTKAQADALLAGKSPVGHGHQISDVEGLDAALDAAGGSASWAQVTDKPTTFPPSPHHHPVSDVTELQAALDSKAAKEPVDLASQDLDTVLDDGPYTQPSSSTASPSLNYPVNASGAAQAGHLRVQSRPGNYLVLQEYTTFEGGAKFWRTRYAGTWNPWYLVVDSSDPRLIGETGWDDAIAALNAAAA